MHFLLIYSVKLLMQTGKSKQIWSLLWRTHLDSLPCTGDEGFPLVQFHSVKIELPWICFHNTWKSLLRYCINIACKSSMIINNMTSITCKRTVRILMVSSKSSRSHSIDLKLFLSSLVVQSTSSLVALPGSWSSSVHLWYRPCAVFTAFWTSLKHSKHQSVHIWLKKKLFFKEKKKKNVF